MPIDPDNESSESQDPGGLPDSLSGEAPTRDISPAELAAFRSSIRPPLSASDQPTVASNTLSPTQEPLGHEIPLPGDEIRGTYRYRLDKRLGAGAFGSVFLATCLDREPNNREAPPERVAVKIFHMADRTKATRMIRRELQPLLRLRHPRIPAVYDWAVRGPVIFVVMQYFPSGSLLDLRSYFGTMTEEQGWQLLTDLLSGLKAAHGQSILHLDIKPANVLVDANGRFALSDFGIAAGVLVPWRLTPPGLGTPGYRAEEQQEIIDRIGQVDESTILDVRTDLRGLGATMWAAFTGISPGSEAVKLYESEEDSRFSLPRLSRLRPDCSQEFEQVIMSLLCRDREERPGSAAEVLATIKRLRSEGALDAREYTNLLGNPLNDAEREALIDSLMDPVWADLCRNDQFARHIVRFDDNVTVIQWGDSSYLAYVLLQGKFTVERHGVQIATVEHEGSFVGEVATLTGRVRTATVRTKGPVTALVFNAAELERLVTCNPSVAVRLVKTLAARFAEERLGSEEHS